MRAAMMVPFAGAGVTGDACVMAGGLGAFTNCREAFAQERPRSCNT